MMIRIIRAIAKMSIDDKYGDDEDDRNYEKFDNYAGDEEKSDISFSGILKLRHIRKCGGK